MAHWALGGIGRLVLWIAAGAVALVALRALDTGPFLAAQLDLGPWGPVAFVALCVLATVLFLPGSRPTLGTGAVFGVLTGAVTVSIAATAGATAAFPVAAANVFRPRSADAVE